MSPGFFVWMAQSAFLYSMASETSSSTFEFDGSCAIRAHLTSVSPAPVASRSSILRIWPDGGGLVDKVFRRCDSSMLEGEVVLSLETCLM